MKFQSSSFESVWKHDLTSDPDSDLPDHGYGDLNFVYDISSRYVLPFQTFKSSLPTTSIQVLDKFMSKMCGQKGLKYSRTSVARTLMARLPWLFRTRSRVHWNKNP